MIDLGTPGGRQELVRRHADALYRWAWVRAEGKAEVAQEVVQRSFLSAFERPGAYDPARGEPWGWLVGLALNHLKALRRERGFGALRPGQEPAVSPPHPMEALESREQVRLALTALPPGMQRLLEGHYLEGKPVERLAEEMDLAPSTAWARLAQAREAFRKALKEKEMGEEHA